MSTRVPAGTVKPACPAMNAAGFPTSFGLGRRYGETRIAPSLSASAGDMKYAPCRVNSRFTSSATAVSTPTELGDVQMTPLLYDLPMMVSLAVAARPAERPMNHGALPGLTPYAGLPAL